MITWIILWIILLCIFGLLVAMEIVNGSIEKRFWVCCILLFILIMIPVFTLGAYKQSVEFYQEYASFAERAQYLTDDQEYTELGRAVNYNYKLEYYQTRIKILGIFAPYYHGIWNLEPIHLKNFDMDHYRWWDD